MGMPVAPAFDQDGWRTRTNVPDPSGVNAAYDGGDDAANTDWTQDADVLFRTRLVVKQTVSTAINHADLITNFILQYNNTTAGSGWVNVGAVGGDVEDVQFIAASGFADGDNTTQLVGGGTFVTGDGVENDTASDNVTFTESTTTETELEFSLEIVGAQVTDADTIDLRLLYSAGDESPPATTMSGTNIPTVTANVAAVPKSDSDTGTLAEDVPEIALTGVGDTGTLADAAPAAILAATLDDEGDTASLAEGPAIALTGEGDTATLADDAFFTSAGDDSETGTLDDAAAVTATLEASDTGSLEEKRTEVSIADTPGDFATFSESTVLDQGVGDESKSGTDTATLAETAFITATITNDDTATLADDGTITVTLSDSDTGSLASSEEISATVDGDDTATLADDASLTATLSASDTGTLAEDASITATLTASDTGTLADNGVVVATAVKTGTDTGTLVDDAFFTSAGDDGETGTLDDVAGITAATSASDTGASAEDPTIAAVVTAGDTATLADDGVVDESVAKSDGDTAILAESVTITATVATPDTGVLVDDALITSAGDDGETGTLDDVTAITAVTAVDDTGTEADDASLTATLDVDDTGSLASGEDVPATVSANDTVTLAESTDIDEGTVPKSDTDTGTLAEDASITATLSTSDTAILSDTGDALKTDLGAPPRPPSQIGGAILPPRPLKPRRRRIRPKEVAITASDAFQWGEATKKQITPIEAGMMSRILRDRAAEVLQDAREPAIFTQAPEPVALSWTGDALVAQPGPAVLEAEEDELIVLLIKSGLLN